MEPSPQAGTARTLLCPECGQAIMGDSRSCPNCGVDLVLLALLAERTFLQGAPLRAPAGAPLDLLVPRLGEFLIREGYLSKADLDLALQRQQANAQRGQHALLGQTLLEMQLVDRETLDRAITSQIIELHAALQEANRTLEQRVAERTAELQRALGRLTELNQIKANLISNISHELRTPLAHIKGYLELLTDRQIGDLTEEQDKALQVMLRSTLRLERLIEDLISFSTASREGLSLAQERFSLGELAQTVISRSSQKAEQAGVRLQLELAADLPDFKADREKLGWVLYQLVDNGIKFTPTGGSVTISAGSADGWIKVSVQDTGIGIPQDRLEEIFEPFHQLDGSPTRRYGGTGLGLSLVRQIISAHGGKLEVQSEENRGSSFQFSLPLRAEDP